jgi:hypothetical protein
MFCRITHRFEGLLPQAVNPFALVGANDDIAKSSAVLKNEDSIGLAALTLATARGTTVELEER